MISVGATPVVPYQTWRPFGECGSIAGRLVAEVPADAQPRTDDYTIELEVDQPFRAILCGSNQVEYNYARI
jgi:hypothetical protein